MADPTHRRTRRSSRAGARRTGGEGPRSRPLGRHEHHERRAQLLDLPLLARVRCITARVPRRAA
eukprot:scaffold14564_cov123-Isochrysis_galbana.AAC.2